MDPGCIQSITKDPICANRSASNAVLPYLGPEGVEIWGLRRPMQQNNVARIVVANLWHGALSCWNRTSPVLESSQGANAAVIVIAIGFIRAQIDENFPQMMLESSTIRMPFLLSQQRHSFFWYS
ncbi:hypothetical protein GQX74_002002 [Glossina fuscipes]|nr:hypothetical protein GQX74_002002 [Glossina fuscipes]